MLLEDVNMFIVLAEYKNYTNAAEALYISQSSLSKRIQKLEQSAGVKLFTRTTKSVELSRYGQIYYKYAKQIQTASEACTREIRECISNGNVLTIGCIPSITQYRIPTLLFHYMSESGIQCRIQTDQSSVLEQKLLNGEQDLAFIRDANASLPLKMLPFVTDHMMAVLPKSHRLAGRSAISVKELDKETFLLHPKESRPYKKVIALCRKENFEPNVIYTDSHMRNICSLVASGMGVSLLMEHLIPPDIPDIVAVPLTPEEISQITLCYAAERSPTTPQRDFLSFYRKQTKREQP
ncbi:MAG: LysR family transcriptional regulator [Gemmiger sp.]